MNSSRLSRFFRKFHLYRVCNIAFPRAIAAAWKASK